MLHLAAAASSSASPSSLRALFHFRLGNKDDARSSVSSSVSLRRTTNLSVSQRIRGGDQTDAHGDDDEERYSRQVYTLGARAHRLVRSATVFLDGPPESGLVYECAKNLALSGVGSIVVLTHESSETESGSTESGYHNPKLDDLGKAYGRAARAELGHVESDGAETSTSSDTILMEYIKRLNPSVLVSSMRRAELSGASMNGRGVLVAIDRPQSTQVALNDMCREKQIAFVAIETAGVYGRTFCDLSSQPPPPHFSHLVLLSK